MLFILEANLAIPCVDICFASTCNDHSPFLRLSCVAKNNWSWVLEKNLTNLLQITTSSSLSSLRGVISLNIILICVFFSHIISVIHPQIFDHMKNFTPRFTIYVRIAPYFPFRHLLSMSLTPVLIAPYFPFRHLLCH